MKKWKTTMRGKLTVYNFLLVTLIVGLSITILASYFTTVMKKRIISEYSSELDYKAKQLDNFRAEIEQYAKLIAADADLQNKTSIKNIKSDTIYKTYKIHELLRSYKTIKSYIQEIDLVIASGEIYSSDSSNKNGMYQYSESGWIEEFKDNNQERGFSREHQLIVEPGNAHVNVLTYVLPINNYIDNKLEYGHLFIHVNAQQFKLLFGSKNSETNWLLLVADDKRVVYGQYNGSHEKSDLLEIIRKYEWQDNNVIYLNHERLLCSHMINDGMKLYMSISDENIIHEINNISIIFLLIFLLALVVSMIIILFISYNITKPIKELTEAAKDISAGKKNVKVDVHNADEIGILATVFNDMVISLDGQMEQIKWVEKEKSDLKIDVLMAQINPHFIYNTLNSAIYLAKMGENKKVEGLIRSFLDLLQDNLKSGVDGAVTTIQEEVQCIYNYRNIQIVRYPERFTLQIECEEELNAISVPRLLLQPIVENALYHGILPEEKQGKILIRIYKDNGFIHFLVQDNGMGIEEDKIESVLNQSNVYHGSQMHSIGIANVIERLKLIYKGNYRFIIESTVGEGTKIHIFLPFYFDQKLT